MKWELSETKIPSKPEVQQLVKVIKERADAAKANLHRQPTIDWAVLHCFLASGVRSQELADIQVGDLRIGHGEAAILVRSGKGGKSRLVAVTDRLKKHLTEFLYWKERRGEPVTPESPLFLSAHKNSYSTRSIRHLFKRCLRRAGVKTHYGCHSLRHFHLSQLYNATKDLRMTQDQAGHSSPATTAIYAHVSLENRQQAISGLF